MIDSNETVSADAPCQVCGYNLRGLLSSGRCPECGSDDVEGSVRLATRNRVRPLHPGFSRMAIVTAAIAIGCNFIFRWILHRNGLVLQDLWGGGIRAIPAPASAFVGPAGRLFGVLCYYLLVAGAYAIAVGISALLRGDRMSSLVVLVALVLIGMAGCQTIEIIVTLAVP